jgi:hypothetical protein
MSSSSVACHMQLTSSSIHSCSCRHNAYRPTTMAVSHRGSLPRCGLNAHPGVTAGVCRLTCAPAGAEQRACCSWSERSGRPEGSPIRCMALALSDLGSAHDVYYLSRTQEVLRSAAAGFVHTARRCLLLHAPGACVASHLTAAEHATHPLWATALTQQALTASPAQGVDSPKSPSAVLKQLSRIDWVHAGHDLLVSLGPST